MLRSTGAWAVIVLALNVPGRTPGPSIAGGVASRGEATTRRGAGHPIANAS